jgi:hypothetical protein
MILMALLVRLPIPVLTAFSIVIIAGHNITDYFQQLEPVLVHGKTGWLWKIFYFGGALEFGHSGPAILILYTYPALARPDGCRICLWHNHAHGAGATPAVLPYLGHCCHHPFHRVARLELVRRPQAMEAGDSSAQPAAQLSSTPAPPSAQASGASTTNSSSSAAARAALLLCSAHSADPHRGAPCLTHTDRNDDRLAVH